jgi:hypothetical protein
MNTTPIVPGDAGSKKRLFEIGLKALEENGYKIERIPGIGKSSVRRIKKDGQSKVVSIKTTQDTWIAFQRNDTSWITLPDVDAVVAVSIDRWQNAKFIQVHMIDGKDMLERFDRAYAARLAAGNKISPGSGVWVSLYDKDEVDPISHVGGGAGLANPCFFRTPLNAEEPGLGIEPAGESLVTVVPPPSPSLTIPEAKRLLAITFGVDPSNIKITVEA